MRISSAAILLALAACAPDPGGAVAAVEDGDALIDCALGGSSAFERGCAVEWIGAGEDRLLVIRHPDGGFRRFDAPGGAAVETADGVEDADVALSGDIIEVTVGNDRYRLPTAILRNDPS